MDKMSRDGEVVEILLKNLNSVFVNLLPAVNSVIMLVLYKEHALMSVCVLPCVDVYAY